MNYLGHLLLTYPYSDFSMGNLLGDMLSGKEVQGLPQPLQRGVEMHRFIDRYTDTHEGIRRLVGLLREHQGKYAPVAVDILLDHVLALQWDEHAVLSYHGFTSWVYREMVPAHLNQVGERVSSRLERMVEHRWLDGYPTALGMYAVLRRMDRRAAFPSNFTGAMTDFSLYRETFQTVFREFYQEIREALTQEFLESRERPNAT